MLLEIINSDNKRSVSEYTDIKVKKIFIEFNGYTIYIDDSTGEMIVEKYPSTVGNYGKKNTDGFR